MLIDVCIDPIEAQQISGLRNYRSLDNTHNSEINRVFTAVSGLSPGLCLQSPNRQPFPFNKTHTLTAKISDRFRAQELCLPSVVKSGYRSDNKNHRSPADST
jgi:hypothetical protein